MHAYIYAVSDMMDVLCWATVLEGGREYCVFEELRTRCCKLRTRCCKLRDHVRAVCAGSAHVHLSRYLAQTRARAQ